MRVVSHTKPGHTRKRIMWHRPKLPCMAAPTNRKSFRARSREIGQVDPSTDMSDKRCALSRTWRIMPSVPIEVHRALTASLLSASMDKKPAILDCQVPACVWDTAGLLHYTPQLRGRSVVGRSGKRLNSSVRPVSQPNSLRACRNGESFTPKGYLDTRGAPSEDNYCLLRSGPKRATQ